MDRSHFEAEALRLTAGESSIVVSSTGYSTVALVVGGRRKVLGRDGAEEVRRKLLASLDPESPHGELPSEQYAHLLGPRCIGILGLHPTSAIYGSYLSGGILRLVVQGAEGDEGFEAVLDISPSDRSHWRHQLRGWRSQP